MSNKILELRCYNAMVTIPVKIVKAVILLFIRFFKNRLLSLQFQVAIDQKTGKFHIFDIKVKSFSFLKRWIFYNMT